MLGVLGNCGVLIRVTSKWVTNLTDTSCTCNNLFLYRSEQPKTTDESGMKSEKERFSVESPLESLAEAMLEPGYVLFDTLRS